MPTEVVAAALAAVRNGDPIRAARMLEVAADGSDGEAALTLAHWRLSGEIIRRDLALARQFFGRAAELGRREAAAAYIAMLANGAGGSGRRWPEAIAQLEARLQHDPEARAELELIGGMAIDPDGEPTGTYQRRELSTAPSIQAIPGFLTRDECAFLARLARPRLQPAVVIDPRTGQYVRHPVRTAHSVGFPFVDEGPALHAINRRIAAATGTSYEQGEPTQILSYGPGQEYKLHSDALASDPNQRVGTFLITLEDQFEGGATLFPRLDIRWRGNVGDALHFVNVDAAQRPHPGAWHAGEPVTKGRKVLLSKWIRAHALDLSGPPGRPL
jgi:prolyl 4-hydroxylase